MLKKHLRSVQFLGLATVSVLVAVATAARAAAVPKDSENETTRSNPAAQKTFDKLIGAIKANNRTAFVADATDAVKQGFTPQVMEALNKQLGSRLKKGFEATYLSRLKQAGHQIHLWKVSFKDKGDDVLVRIVLKENKVAGFFLQ